MEDSSTKPAPEHVDPRWDELQTRCEAANLSYQLLGKPSFQIALVEIPEEGSEPHLVVWNQNVSDVLEFEFEKFRLIASYFGVCSPADGTIEAFVETAIGTVPLRKVLDGLVADASDSQIGELPITLEADGVTIELGPPSKELVALVGNAGDDVRGADGAAIKIKGVSIGGSGTGRSLLEKYADALLFQFDTRFQQPLVLSRRQQLQLPFPAAGKGKGKELVFPQSEFDHEPMSLYWYGRGAHGLPLLEFFAYYQVLEYYYEHYVDADGRRRISQVLKDPAFSPHDDRYVSRVLRAAGRGSGSRRNERDQLLTTIRGCADAVEIRSFISGDEKRKKFFEEKDPRLTQKGINVAVSDGELLQQVADRIYDLRCKIVHTKEGGNGEGVELLLPHSPEAGRLHADIALLRLIARQALIAASRPMG